MLDARSLGVPTMGRSCARATAPVEVALVLPFVMVLLLGMLGAARITQPLLGINAVAREAARAGALGDSADQARLRAEQRGAEVARDYGLTHVTIDADVSRFGPEGEVRVTASYTVHLSAVPLLHWSDLRLQRSHAELVGLWRSIAANQ